MKFKTKSNLRICTITGIVDETPTIKTFRFKDEMDAQAGQFVMVWVPGVDEIPMSVSYTGIEKGITVAKVGDATSKLHTFSEGSKLGIRGPYGNGFDITKAKRILAVAGGCGSAPLGPILDQCKTENMNITFAIGARTKSELLFKNRASALGVTTDLSTDDGSEGYHGFVTERMSQLLSEQQFDLVLGCGPEIMMKKVLDLANKHQIKVQMSLERYMKCGIGICDACSIDGYQVCRDGPVFSGETLAKLSEFGTYQHDACGRVVEV